MEELDESEEGITARAKLVSHFERSAQDLRLDMLLSQWEREELHVGEHPDMLFARLSSINRKLTALGEGFSKQITIRRFVSAIERQQDHPYEGALQQHRGQMIKGDPYTLEELREFLAHVYTSQTTKRPAPAMKGLATIMECKRYGKRGHTEQQCWKSKQEGTKPNTSIKKCWKCGKSGHLRRDCRSAGTSEHGIA
ncbi:MAG: hypothetical protein GY791_07625, partial [Alphaproteobacteria bacterium]|nr:hypothetical protein [Alphaproteobacteria bacterium]